MLAYKWDTKDLFKKLDMIIDTLPKSATTGVKMALESTQQDALSRIRGKNDSSMIPYEIKNEEKIIGSLKTNFDYALFLEYGTGIYAEMDHIGKTKTFIQSGYRYWYLPVDKSPRVFDEVVIFNGQKYYKMYAQYPKPFMRPAGFENRDTNIELIEKEISKMLKGAIK